MVIDPPLFPDKYRKKLHVGFVVMYYHPPKACLGGETYIHWVYGIDIIKQVKKVYKDRTNDIYFLKVDGSQDMSKIYPVVNYMLRPSRHDGMPRMNIECDNNDIPYYYTEDGNPRFIDIINDISKHYRKWKK